MPEVHVAHAALKGEGDDGGEGGRAVVSASPVAAIEGDGGPESESDQSMRTACDAERVFDTGVVANVGGIADASVVADTCVVPDRDLIRSGSVSVVLFSPLVSSLKRRNPIILLNSAGTLKF